MYIKLIIDEVMTLTPDNHSDSKMLKFMVFTIIYNYTISFKLETQL